MTNEKVNRKRYILRNKVTGSSFECVIETVTMRGKTGKAYRGHAIGKSGYILHFIESIEKAKTFTVEEVK